MVGQVRGGEAAEAAEAAEEAALAELLAAALRQAPAKGEAVMAMFVVGL